MTIFDYLSLLDLEMPKLYFSRRNAVEKILFWAANKTIKLKEKNRKNGKV
jgi:hypothetical protein